MQVITQTMISFAQDNEDVVLLSILNSIGVETGICIDLGAGDGHYLSNTKLLEDELSLTRVMVDVDSRGNKDVIEKKVTLKNIHGLLKKYKGSRIDLLSIDIDGNDYWILKEVLTICEPRVIICEYNPKFKAEESKAIIYNEDHAWEYDDYYGASFSAYVKLLSPSYGLAFINKQNIIFVRLNEGFSPFLKPETTAPTFNPHKVNSTKEWKQV